MARTRKFASVQNLYKYDVLIEDSGSHSDYFKISQFDGYLYGGRNAFLIAGSSVLRPNTKILVEILDKNGGTLFSTPVSGYIEGNSRLIQIEVYKDTPIGAGKLVVLGCAETYLNGTVVPSEWRDRYNVRWVVDVIISPLFENKTPIRFTNPPRIVVEEKQYASPVTASFSQSITEPFDIKIAPKYFNVFYNGYVVSTEGSPTARYFTKHLGGKFTGSIQWSGSLGSETASIDLPITRIFNRFTAEANGIVLYSDKNTLITDVFISQSGQYQTMLNKSIPVGITSSLNLVYSEQDIQGIGPSRSYAEVRIVDLATLSGEINKVQLSYKGLTDEGEFTLLSEIPTTVRQLLVVDSGSRIVETGRFRDIEWRDYWYSATMSLVRNELNPTLPTYYSTGSLIPTSSNALQTCFFLLDAVTGTPEIVDNKFIDDKSYFIGTREENSIRLFPRSEYTLAFEALVSRTTGSIELMQDDYSMEVYLVPVSGSADRVLTTDPRGQLLGTLTPTQTFQRQNFETVNFNFFPQIPKEGDYGLRFVVYGGAWNIANVSVKVAQEEFFSPDEITALVPNEFKNRDFVIYKAEFLDVDNNSTAITATSIPTYFDGVGYVKRSGDSMYGELEIKGFPIHEHVPKDAHTGLVSGGILTTSSVYSQAYEISAGYGYIIDNYTNPDAPLYTKVEWPDLILTASAFATSGSAPSYPRTNVAINIDGTAHEQSTKFTNQDYREKIILGRLAHVGTTFIQRTLSLPLTSYNRGFHWFDLASSLGTINVTGNVIEPLPTPLQIRKTTGQTYRVGSNYVNDTTYPDITTDPLVSPITFAYRYRSATPGVFIETPLTTLVSSSIYDNGTGTLANPGNNNWTAQRVYYFAATNTIRIQPGQTVYGSRTAAVAGALNDPFVVDPNFTDDAAFRAVLILRASNSQPIDLNNVNDAEFVTITGTGGGGGGGGGDPFPYSGSADISGSLSLQGLAIISGALDVVGPVTASIFTGSLSGSLIGTSSWATSASYAIVAESIRIIPGDPSMEIAQYTGSFTGSFTGSLSGNITGEAGSVAWSNISGHRTLTRVDAGLQGSSGARSGFFETFEPINYYTGASNWQHLIEARHSNDENNFAMQLAGSFFDQALWFRKTNGSPTTAWRRVVTDDTETTWAINISGTSATGSSVTFANRTTNESGHIAFISTTATGNQPLYSNTNIRVNPSLGSITATAFTETSTRELKDNITPVESQLENLQKLNPVRFTWKENGKDDMGLIAEEVAQIYPELVEYDQAGNPIGVHYSRLVTVLIKELQEQRKILNKLMTKE
jgi:hypothetical protein